ncbi:MAG: toll/interleukin-1 receptor domain-containing protein [Actinophytocola sp.]|uniref:toll/interleukin-1 receptor domain-containing protein n=1 Tax=Actinophytocola sp. TaxID=1872138 RepID=UPI003D6B9EE3
MGVPREGVEIALGPDGGIFVNYRQVDHALFVAALQERLARHFGEDKVFFDTRSMRPGEVYPGALRARLTGVDVLLAIIHPTWEQEVVARAGEQDWVREEIATALGSGRTTVLPVLLNDTILPGKVDLPEQLHGLLLRQVCRIQWRTFERDLAYLIRALETMVARAWQPPPDPPPHRRRPIWAGRMRLLGALVALLGLALPPVLTVVADPVAPGAAFNLLAALALVSVIFAVSGLIVVAAWPAVLAASRHSTRALQVDGSARRLFGLVLMLGVPLVVLLLFGVPFAVRQSDPTESVLMLALACVLGVVAVGIVVLRFPPDVSLWPPSRPVTLDEASIRQGLAVLREQLADPQADASREHRDQVHWLHTELARRLAELRELPSRPRAEWLRTEHARGLVGVIAWIAGTTGFALAAAVVLGEPAWYLLPAGILGGSVAIGAGMLALFHRGTRRSWVALAGEMADTLDALRPALPPLDGEPRLWLGTPENAAAVPRGSEITLRVFARAGTRVRVTFGHDSGAVAEAVTVPPGFRAHCDVPFDTGRLPAGPVEVTAVFTTPDEVATVTRTAAVLDITPGA